MIDNESKFLVDSNILVYAYDKDSGEKQQKAFYFLSNHLGKETCFLSTQNLAEFAVNITKKVPKPISPEEAKQNIKELSSAAQVIKYSAQTIQDALETGKKYQIHFWDALLVAVMLENGIHTIYTENTQDFHHAKGIKVINPLETKR